MADASIELAVGATTDKVTAGMAVARAEVRSLEREVSRTAAAQVKAGGATEEHAQALVGLASKLNAAKAYLAEMAKGAEEGCAALGKLGADSKHVIAIFDEFSRGARGQMVGSIVALTRDSGALGEAVGALATPFGIATAAAATLAGGLFFVVRAAVEARNALDGVYNAAIVEGRNAEAAVANVQRMVSTITGTGLIGGPLGPGKAMPLAAALEGIPGLSEQAKESLAGVADAWSRIQFGGDMAKAATEIPKMFESIGTMKALIDKNRLLTGSDYQAFAAAAGQQDVGGAEDLFAKGITDRFSRAAKELATEANATTTGLAAALGAQAGAPVGPTVYTRRLPGPLTLPSQEEMNANRYIAEGNKLDNERLGLLRQAKEIEDQIAKGHVSAALGNPAIKRLHDQADDLARREQRQGGDETEELRARQRIADAGAGASKTRGAPEQMHVAEMKATLAAQQQEANNAKLTAAQRTQFATEAANTAKELNNAIAESAVRAGKAGESAAKQGYSVFAEEEKHKLEAARGNATEQTQILDQWRSRAASTFAAGSTAFAKAMADIEGAAQQAAQASIAELERVAAATAHANESILHGFEARMQTGVTRGIPGPSGPRTKITEQQAYGFDIQDVTKLAGQQKSQLDQVMANPAATPQQRQGAYWQEWDLGTQTQAQVTELQQKIAEAGKKAAEAFAAPFRAAFDRLGDSLERALTGALTGEKGKQIGQQLLKSAIGSGVNLVTGTASRVAAGPLAGLLGQGPPKPGQGVGDVLGGAATSWITKGLTSLFPSMGKMFGSATKDLSQTANTTALTALTTAITANTSALLANSAVTTTSSGTSALSAAGSAGGLLSGVKTIGGFLGFAKGGIVPAAAGGWVVPAAAGGWRLPASFGTDRVMAALTPGEMVLPTAISRLVQQNAGVLGAPGAAPTPASGSDFHAHFHGPSDGPQMARFFRGNRQHILDIVRQGMRSGALSPARG